MPSASTDLMASGAAAARQVYTGSLTVRAGCWLSYTSPTNICQPDEDLILLCPLQENPHDI